MLVHASHLAVSSNLQLTTRWQSSLKFMFPLLRLLGHLSVQLAAVLDKRLHCCIKVESSEEAKPGGMESAG